MEITHNINKMTWMTLIGCRSCYVRQFKKHQDEGVSQTVSIATSALCIPVLGRGRKPHWTTKGLPRPANARRRAREGTKTPFDHRRTSKAYKYQETLQHSLSTQLSRNRPTPYKRKDFFLNGTDSKGLWQPCRT